jgi:hypothetical protein
MTRIPTDPPGRGPARAAPPPPDDPAATRRVARGTPPAMTALVARPERRPPPGVLCSCHAVVRRPLTGSGAARAGTDRAQR